MHKPSSRCGETNTVVHGGWLKKELQAWITRNSSATTAPALPSCRDDTGKMTWNMPSSFGRCIIDCRHHHLIRTDLEGILLPTACALPQQILNTSTRAWPIFRAISSAIDRSMASSLTAPAPLPPASEIPERFIASVKQWFLVPHLELSHVIKHLSQVDSWRKTKRN